MVKATTAPDEPDVSLGTSGQRLLLRLEVTSLTIPENSEIHTCYQAAEAAITDARDWQIDEVEWADALRV
jgi:hypothetical protein